MTLQGTLDVFGVADVLQLLSATGKSGRLRVEGDRGWCEVSLRDGAVVGASSRGELSSPPEEVFCDLMRYESGSFFFDTDEEIPETGVAEEVDELLDRAELLLAEWRELQALVPSLDHRVGLVKQLGEAGRVTVTARQWPALVAVGRGCTVSDLAKALGLSDLAALRTVHDLVNAGLTTVHATRFLTHKRPSVP